MGAEKIALAKSKAKNQGKADWECGGWIVKDDKGQYAFTVPLVGSEGGKVDIDNMLVPPEFTKAGAYHTHTDATGRQGEGFSKKNTETG
jgi:hypothetical protein